MNNEFLISIIIPVYKVEKYIENTVKSLICQTCKDFEVIFVDDGTPDDSINVAVNSIKESGLIYRVLHQDNQGQGSARNTGFFAAKGDWIIFLDSDDTIQPFTIELYKKLVEVNPDIDLAFSKYQYIRDEDIFKGAVYSENYSLLTGEKIAHNFLTRESVILVPGTIYRKEFLENNHIEHTSLRWSEDQYFMWQVLDKSHMVAAIDCVTYNYYRHEQTIMTDTNIDKMLEAYRSFGELEKSIYNKEVKQFLQSRWVLGCLREIAGRNNINQWKQFISGISYFEHMKKLLLFPQFKIRLLARIGKLSQHVLYGILRKS